MNVISQPSRSLLCLYRLFQPPNICSMGTHYEVLNQSLFVLYIARYGVKCKMHLVSLLFLRHGSKCRCRAFECSPCDLIF